MRESYPVLLIALCCTDTFWSANLLLLAAHAPLGLAGWPFTLLKHTLQQTSSSTTVDFAGPSCPGSLIVDLGT